MKWLLSALLCLWVLGANVSPQFTPVRSELAAGQGFSRGLVNVVVLAPGDPFARMPPWTFFACAGILLLFARVQPRPLAGWYRAGRATLAGSAVALLAAAAVSPYVSPYRVVLTPRTFALCLVLLCAGRAVGVAMAGARRWAPAGAARRRLLVATAGALGAAFFASAMLQTLAGYGGNYSGFLHLADEVADRAPALQERPELRRSLITYEAGYDGQFMYLIAFDPFLARFGDRPHEYRAFVDNPPYRYARIGFPLMTRLASGQRAERFPAAMLWLIIAGHAALASLLAWIAARHGRSPLVGLWYLAIPGFMSSLMSALPEALAAAGLVAGFLSWEARRPALTALLFGAALLVRETGAILLAALVLGAPAEERRRWLMVAAAALAPVCVWRLFVASRLFADFGWAAIVANPGDFGLPFEGLVRLWLAGYQGAQPPAEVGGALLFPLILTAALVLALLLVTARRGPLEMAAIAYGLVAVSLNYGKIWSHLPSGERGTFELFVCLLLVLLTSREGAGRARPALTGFFVVLLAYTFFVAPDAGVSRAALLLIR